MNLRLVSIYQDYKKQAGSPKSIDEALDYTLTAYGIDHVEVQELVEILFVLLQQKFPDRDFSKKKNKELIDGELDVLIETFLFGMFVANFMEWDWPKK
jgi:hypothetical protein